MLVVKEPYKLEKYGFKMGGLNGIYEKVIYTDKDDRGTISLLINNQTDLSHNEITLYVDLTIQEKDGICYFDELASLELVYDLIKDGIIEKA